MCRKKDNNTPLESISREKYYDIITASISKYIKRTNQTKFVFQIILGIIASLLILGITIAFGLLIMYVLRYKGEGELDSSTAITTIITSSATYAASLIGTLAIVVNYMFNKNDISDHTQLLKSFLDSDLAKEEPTFHDKTASKLTTETGLADAINDALAALNDNDSNQKPPKK